MELFAVIGDGFAGLTIPGLWPDLAALDEIDVVGQMSGVHRIGLANQHAHRSGLAKLGKYLRDALGKGRRNPFERFVKQQQFVGDHQRPRERNELLLATTQLRGPPPGHASLHNIRNRASDRGRPRH